MAKFFCDGIEYTFEESSCFGGSEVSIEVFSAVDGEYVGMVELDHSLECASSEINGESDSISYYEFAEKTPEDIAHWIAAVSC